MLNRRTIRIKAMQSLFAYEQCKRADYNIALEQIETTFSPDLNSMEKQDKKLLKIQATEATKIFRSEYRKNKVVKSGSEPIINKVVNLSDFLKFFFLQYLLLPRAMSLIHLQPF